jgi:hypothetical protein
VQVIDGAAKLSCEQSGLEFDVGQSAERVVGFARRDKSQCDTRGHRDDEQRQE